MSRLSSESRGPWVSHYSTLSSYHFPVSRITVLLSPLICLQPLGNKLQEGRDLYSPPVSYASTTPEVASCPLLPSWSLLPTASQYPLHSLCCLLRCRKTPSNWVVKSKDCQLCTSDHPELNVVIRHSSGRALAAIPNSFKFCPLRHTQPGNEAAMLVPPIIPTLNHVKRLHMATILFRVRTLVFGGSLSHFSSISQAEMGPGSVLNLQAHCTVIIIQSAQIRSMPSGNFGQQH